MAPQPGDEGFLRDAIDAELKFRFAADPGAIITADFMDISWVPSET